MSHPGRIMEATTNDYIPVDKFPDRSALPRKYVSLGPRLLPLSLNTAVERLSLRGREIFICHDGARSRRGILRLTYACIMRAIRGWTGAGRGGGLIITWVLLFWPVRGEPSRVKFSVTRLPVETQRISDNSRDTVRARARGNARGPRDRPFLPFPFWDAKCVLIVHRAINNYFRLGSRWFFARSW